MNLSSIDIRWTMVHWDALNNLGSPSLTCTTFLFSPPAKSFRRYLAAVVNHLWRKSPEPRARKMHLPGPMRSMHDTNVLPRFPGQNLCRSWWTQQASLSRSVSTFVSMALTSNSDNKRKHCSSNITADTPLSKVLILQQKGAWNDWPECSHLHYLWLWQEWSNDHHHDHDFERTPFKLT